jgi:hypothetical protein
MDKEIRIPLKKVIFYLIILLVLFFVYFIVKNYFFSGKYVAVYVRTGELYFGKIYYFPRLKLKDAVILQMNEQRPTLSSLKTTFWDSKGSLFLTKENIVWISPIREGSNFVEQIKNLNQVQAPSLTPQSNLPTQATSSP